MNDTRGSSSISRRLGWFALACTSAASALALFAGVVSAAPDGDRYAIVNSENEIVNTVTWDGVSPWSPPDGCIAVPDPRGEAEIRGHYIDGRFVAVVVVPDPEAVARDQAIAAREAALEPLRQKIKARTATHEELMAYIAARDGID